MEQPMTTLPLIVALALAGAGVCAAYRNPNLGAALLVGVAILTALYVVWEKDLSVFQTNAPGSSPVAPAPAPHGGGAVHTPTNGPSAGP
jgi:hypothetical protein